MDRYPHTLKYCRAVLETVNNGFLLQRMCALDSDQDDEEGREGTGVCDSLLHGASVSGRQTETLPLDLLAVHLGSSLCAVQGVLGVLAHAKQCADRFGTIEDGVDATYCTVSALLLTGIDTLCNIAICADAKDSTCGDILETLRGTHPSPHADTHMDTSSVIPLRTLGNLLLAARDSYCSSRKVPRLPCGTLFGLVSYCCTLLCKQSVTQCNSEDALLVVAILQCVYDDLCRVCTEDEHIGLHHDRVLRLAVERGIVKDRRSVTSITRQRWRGGTGRRSSYQDLVTFSSEESEEDNADDSRDGETYTNIPTHTKEKSHETADLDVSATGTELDALSTRIAGMVTCMYQAMPRVIADKLDRTELTLSAGVSRLVSASERRLRNEEYGRFRSALFALRADVCLTIRHLMGSRQGTGSTSTSDPHDTDHIARLVLYFCTELKHAVKDGLTVRNFKVH